MYLSIGKEESLLKQLEKKYSVEIPPACHKLAKLFPLLYPEPKIHASPESDLLWARVDASQSFLPTNHLLEFVDDSNRGPDENDTELEARKLETDRFTISCSEY